MTGRPADPVLAAALQCARAGQSAILVTIAAAKGSTPRVPGTRMLVGPLGIIGSVGGGQLEFEITDTARKLIATGALASSRQHFILGPDLRQCCGGALDVVLEPVTQESRIWLEQALRWDGAGQSWQSSLLIGEPSQARDVRLVQMGEVEPGVARLRKTEAGAMLVEASGVPWRRIYVFGAGHVGRALVRLLDDLPYHVIWSDGRPDIFPSEIPANVTIDDGGINAELIKAAPEDAHFLIMTHSHALDFEIVQAILQHGRFASLGLIGSDTKRARFVQRLREAGIDDPTIARLQCPIGLAGIKSKIPAAIAIAIVAELLLRPEAGAAGVQLQP